MIPVIAIFDIGKTNKKFFLLDETYRIVLERFVTIEETKDEDGDSCDNINLLSHWVLDTFADVLRIEKFDIRAVNFSAYGASFVYIDEGGQAIAPLYNYLKTYPEQLKDGLYNKYGGAIRISCETASPVLGSLNSGMQLYRVMKEKPDLYSKMKWALHLPQFISYLLSHRACSDITSIGSHTQLWDFAKNGYHQWVTSEGINDKLAPLVMADSTVDFIFSGKKIKAGIGLHDSSAALIPYLTVFTEPFILLSTGTWCISLNPFNNTPLTVEELQQDCLCYMEYKGKPVKASRLFAGHDHDQQVKILAEHFNKPTDHYKRIEYDASIVNSLQRKYDFDKFSTSKDVGVNQSNFGNRDLTEFENYTMAYHCLMLDIIRQQYHSTSLIIKGSRVNRIFVDGGFSGNTVYMHLLALAFPELEVYAASVAQAAAMGAALAIHSEWNSLPVPADMIKLNYFKVAGALNITT